MAIIMKKKGKLIDPPPTMEGQHGLEASVEAHQILEED